MARKKLSLIVQAINLFNSLNEADQATLAEYVHSQLRKPRASSKRTSKSSGEKVDGKLLKLLQEKTGASAANCKAVLLETNGEVDTAESLLRARRLAVKGSNTED